MAAPTSEYKVKIDDGSVVGPFDVPTLQTWYYQKLINKDSPVLVLRTNRWTTLREVLNLGKDQKKREEEEAEEAAEVYASAAPERSGRMVAGLFLILGSAAAIFLGFFRPELWRADMSPAPWREMGYAQILLAITALHGATWTRRVARTGVFLAGVALFPLLGFLMQQGLRPEGMAVMASALLMISGLFFLLSPSMAWTRLAGSVVSVLIGAYGIFRFGVVLAASGVAVALTNIAPR
jgi:hypothetical protein